MTPDDDQTASRPSRWVLASVVATALLATAVTAGVRLTDGGAPSAVPSSAAPSASPAPPEEPRLTDAEVVDHRDARLRELIVAPSDGQTRVSLWQLCLDRRCSRVRQALAVTDDGFTTRSEISVPGRAPVTLASLGPDAFYLGWSRSSQLVVHGDGSTSPVLLEGGPGPLRKGEVLVSPAHRPGSFLAVDPATGHGHGVSVPSGAHELAALADGTLLGSAYDPQTRAISAAWSDDGGASWHERELPTDHGSLVRVIPSARPGVLALVEGGDGATLFPFERLHRSLDGGATWEALDLADDPRAYLGDAAVLPDGRLLVDIEAWSDQQSPGPGSRPTGLHVSAGSDWSDLSAVDPGAPFDQAGDDLFLRSRDGGRRWAEASAR